MYQFTIQEVTKLPDDVVLKEIIGRSHIVNRTI